MKERFSEGKSGSFFYFTTDKKFIVKTISEHEALTALTRAKGLLQHVRSNPKTLLHYYGIYAIQPSHMNQAIFMAVMKNLFDRSSIAPSIKVSFQEAYDLKGALFLRSALSKASDLGSCTALDLDWVRMEKRINANDADKRRIYDQLCNDLEFLKEQNLMDYSLLLGFAQTEGAQDQLSGAPTVLPGSGGQLYFLGIIDITEEWHCGWAVQGNILGCLLAFVCSSKPEFRSASITAVNPKIYAERFKSFMCNNVLQLPDVEGSAVKGSVVPADKLEIESDVLRV